MRIPNYFLLLAFLTGWSCGNHHAQTDKIPLAPNIISTKNVEYATTFSPDGKEVYFARSEQKWGSSGMKSAIYHAVFNGDSWSEPQLAPFSGLHDDSDPHMTPDGTTIYFVSNRPSDHPVSSDIWKVELLESGVWGKPEVLPYPINSEASEYSPTTDVRGNLYFASTRSGGYGQGDLYVSNNKSGILTDPLNLGKTINTPTGEWNLEVSDNGNILIFEASGREENISSYGDLYISFKENETWTHPQNMQELNSTGSDLYPLIMESSAQLFYTSSDSLSSGNTTIYQVDFHKILEKYRKSAQIPETD
nr:hypothetical protein [Allomuricauda sp.]